MQCNRVTGCEAGFFSFLWLMRGFEPTFLTAVRVCANGRVLWLASLVTPQLEDYDLVLSVELQGAFVDPHLRISITSADSELPSRVQSRGSELIQSA
jgi:hypothetical protein